MSPISGLVSQYSQKTYECGPKHFQGMHCICTHFFSWSALDIIRNVKSLPGDPKPLSTLLLTCPSVFLPIDIRPRRKGKNSMTRKEQGQNQPFGSIVIRQDSAPDHPKSAFCKPLPGKVAYFNCGVPEHRRKECPRNGSQPPPKASPTLQEDGPWRRQWPHPSHGSS